MGGGGGGKGSAPSIPPATVTPTPAPVREVNPEAKDTTIQVQDDKAQKAAAAKRSVYASDAESLGSPSAAGSVYARTLGG